MAVLYHFTDSKNLPDILKNGLLAKSKYESFSKMRENCVFCWLSRNDQKLFSKESVCLKIEAEDSSCTVAEMDYLSMAMMYKYGGKKYGGKNIPVNETASRLFIKLYETTAMPLAQYDNNFFTPEVLVSGSVAPERITEIK